MNRTPGINAKFIDETGRAYGNNVTSSIDKLDKKIKKYAFPSGGFESVGVDGIRPQVLCPDRHRLPVKKTERKRSGGHCEGTGVIDEDLLVSPSVEQCPQRGEKCK